MNSKNVLKEEGAMEEILQDIHEFPDFGFIFVLLFISLIGIPTAYYLRPPHYPCKYLKIVVLLHIVIGVVVTHFIGTDQILHKEELPFLTKSEGILKYKEPRSRNRGGYYLVDLSDGNLCWLSFMLCDDSPKEYLSKKVTIWHDNTVVYQMQFDDEIIFDIDNSNKKVWLGNLFYFETWLTVFIIMLISIFAMLHELNNHYKGVSV